MRVFATPRSGASPLSPNDHVVILVELETQSAFSAKSLAFHLLRNNAAIAMRTADYFHIPTIVTTIDEKGFSGPALSETVGTLDQRPVIGRTRMNWWESAAVIDEVERIGRGRIVLAGPWASPCIVDLVAWAIERGLDAWFIADACGDVSMRAHERAVRRMTRLGARPMTSLQYLFELLRDWTPADVRDPTTEIASTWGGDRGLGVSYVRTMLGAVEAGR